MEGAPAIGCVKGLKEREDIYLMERNIGNEVGVRLWLCEEAMPRLILTQHSGAGVVTGS